MMRVDCETCGIAIEETNSTKVYLEARRHYLKTGHAFFRGVRGMGRGFNVKRKR